MTSSLPEPHPLPQPVSWTGEPAPAPAPLPDARQQLWTQPRRVEPRPARPQRTPDLPDTLKRPLGFNCPACGVVLVIREPHNYDGKPAPCPHCAMTILPPRVVYQTVDLHPLPGLTGRSLSGPRPQRPMHRPDRRGRIAPLADVSRPALPADEA